MFNFYLNELKCSSSKLILKCGYPKLIFVYLFINAAEFADSILLNFMNFCVIVKT